MSAQNGTGRRPSFGDRLSEAVAHRESQIILGIDPDPAKLWPTALDALAEARAQLAASAGEAASGEATEGSAAGAGGPAGSDIAAGEVGSGVAGGVSVTGEVASGTAGGGMPSGSAGDPRLETAAAVLAHCRALIAAVAPAVIAIKPQLACFERLGAPGWLALEHVSAYAKQHGLLVLADGKRGDVPVTAAAYGQALVGGTPSPFGTVTGLGADAFTANPLLGTDTLTPLIDAARAHAAGVFVLVRTSNPGARDLFDLELASGERLWERLATIVDSLGERGAQGIGDVGAVTGATEPQHLARLRELMPHTPFLLPGIGAQGGAVDALAPAFAPGRAAGLVTASRSIANAYEQSGADPAQAARSEAERLREQAWNLG